MRIFKSTLSLIITAVFIAGCLILGAPSSSFAAKTVWEKDDSKLDLFADVRIRLDRDIDDRPGQPQRERSRSRVRFRMGSNFVMNENISFGFRLATESDTLHSSHQTLGLNDRSGTNEDFGLDRAYIMVQHKGAYAWAGKNVFPLWNLGDLLWEGDIQPEGFSAGYKTSYKNTKFAFSLSEFVVNESNWGEDDNIIAYQLKIDTGSDAIGVSIAGGALSFFEGEKGNPDAPLC